MFEETKEARAHFNERTQKLAAQYDQVSPIPGAPINGKLTLGENIGDMGGLSLAYSAYQKYKAEKYPDGKEPILDGFTGNQRFFLADAQVWRSLLTDERMRFSCSPIRTAPANTVPMALCAILRPGTKPLA